jgi:hypothetical protein
MPASAMGRKAPVKSAYCLWHLITPFAPGAARAANGIISLPAPTQTLAKTETFIRWLAETAAKEK